MKTIFPILLTFFICTALTLSSNAQFHYSITIKMPLQFEHDTLNIDINNILENKSFKKVVNKGVVHVKGIMKTQYSSAYIYVTKKEKWIDTGFYFGIKPVMVISQKGDNSSDPFLKCKFENTYFDDLNKRLANYVDDESAAMAQSFKEFRKGENAQKDSLETIFRVKRKVYENKILNFLRNSSTSYFAFDYFNAYFVKRATSTNADSLLTIFYNIFPEKFIKSKAGYAIEADLILKKQIIEGVIAPEFQAKGMDGKMVGYVKSDSSHYTLLQFWASWCVPCVKEIPLIKDIKSKYTENKLRIISNSIDIDSTKWRMAVNKHGLSWDNINDLEVPKKFGISFIPEIFLISPQGVILYSSLQSKDTQTLEKLYALLQTVM